MNKGIQSILKIALPSVLSQAVTRELRSSAQHGMSWLRNRSNYRGQRNLRINVGCGPYPLDGWTNMDLVNEPGVLCWDCRRKWPFDNGSASFIFAEHIFEHLDEPTETTPFLAECFRLLTDEGQLFLMMPMADDPLMEARFYAPLEHVYLHSKQNLRGLLADAGFASVKFDCWACGHETVSARKEAK